MLKVSLHPVELALRHAWTLAHGTRTTQHNLIVALHDTDTGHTGYGEAPAIPYMGVTTQSTAAWLHTNQRRIERARINDCQELHHELTGDAYKNPVAFQDANAYFAICSIDQAAHDLWGKNNKKSIRERLSPGSSRTPPSDYTLGLAPPEIMVSKLKEFPNFPVYKIKLGNPPEAGGIEQDLAIIKRLREETDVPIRVDANTAWTAEQTIRISSPLRDLGVEFIEQPLKPTLPRNEHEAVFFGSDLPIIADESCQTEADVEKCAGLFHGINIKLSKCGGLTPARRMIAHARQLGLRVMAGCMTETTVGISALAQLLPLLDDVDMDGALLLAPGSDIADGVKLNARGIAAFPQGEAAHGNGVRLTRQLKVHELAIKKQ